MSSDPSQPTPDAWTFPQVAEDAIARLVVDRRCDANVLRDKLAAARALPPGATLEQIDTLIRRLAKIRGDLDTFSVTADGLALFSPPQQGPTHLGGLHRHLRWLESVLQEWRGGKRRLDRTTDVSLANVCAYIIDSTGQPHDQEVADLWSAVETADKNIKTADGVRKFRERRADLVASCRQRPGPSSAVQPPPTVPNLTGHEEP